MPFAVTPLRTYQIYAEDKCVSVTVV